MMRERSVKISFHLVFGETVWRINKAEKIYQTFDAIRNE